jgi:hypothetical protein
MVEEWTVVHDRVVKRAEPSKDAKMLGFEKKGAVVSGVIEEHQGVAWLHTSATGPHGDSIDAFMMTDGASVGLGALMERVKPMDPQVSETDYWVVQGTLFKKPGSDPETQKIIKLTRPLGSVVKTTGQIWTGPSGGQWVQIDPGADKPGWLLVEGPGFNVPGAMLERAECGQEPPLVLKLYSMITSSVVCEICVQRGSTISSVKQWIALHDPHGLKASKVLVSSEMPSESEQLSFSIASFPQSKLYKDGMKLGDTGLRSGDQVPYFYLGESADDGRFSQT